MTATSGDFPIIAVKPQKTERAVRNHEHQIELSYSWVKQALQGAGLVARGCKRGVHRKRRPRRPLPGMLLHIEGRRHRWFQEVKRHLVCKPWTIEKADENSNGIP